MFRSEWQSNVIPSECEESRHLAEMLRWRSAWHYYSEALAREFVLLSFGRRFFLSYGRQNDIACHLERMWEISYNRVHLKRDSSRQSLSERHTFWQKILHFTAFRSEWQLCHSEWGRKADEESPTIVAGDSSVICTSEWQKECTETGALLL